MILAVNAVDENTKNCERNFTDGEFEHGSTEKRLFHSLWRRAYARNVSVKTLYDGQFTSQTQLINQIIFYTPRRRSTTVSL